MPQRLYWCNDPAVRGCLLPRLFRRLGHEVIAPSGEPRHETGRLPKSGSQYRLDLAASLLAEKGGEEILHIDEEARCASSSAARRRAPGDIDFAARLRGGRLLVAEVKTRLIPRYARDPATLLRMLRYHLDEPTGAYQAWKELARAGKVHPPPCDKPQRRRDYDSPASIAELVREAAGAVTEGLAAPEKVLPAAALLCTVDGLLSKVETYVANTARYLARLGIGTGDYIVLIIGPRGFTNPESYWVDCKGPACGEIAPRWPQEISHHEAYGGCYQYLGCSECSYRAVCASKCRQLEPGQH